MQTYNDMWISHNDDLDIEVRDDDMPLKIKYIIKKEDLDPKLYVLDSGKYEGLNLIEVYSEDPEYIDWLRTQPDILLQQCIKNI